MQTMHSANTDFYKGWLFTNPPKTEQSNRHLWRVWTTKCPDKDISCMDRRLGGDCTTVTILPQEQPVK